MTRKGRCFLFFLLYSTLLSASESEVGERSPDQVLSKPPLTNAQEQAQKKEQGLVFNMSLATDYVWRGLTQSSNQAVVQGGLDYKFDSGLSLGVWVSSMGPNGSETDFYATYQSEIAENLHFSFGGIFYHYRPNGAGDSGELSFELDYKELHFAISYTSNYFGTGRVSWYYMAGYSLALGEQIDLSVLLGYTDFMAENFNQADYLHAEIALSKSLTNHWGAALFYSDTTRGFKDDHVFGFRLNKLFP